jgi:penicillin-binding protein 2
VAIETNRFWLPGISIRVKPQRRCLHPLLASHVVGYLGEVTRSQLARDQYRDHRMGDLAGQYGIEMEMESFLHGRRGQRLVEVDAVGRVLKLIHKVDPVPGDNLVLTLDAKLQQVAQDALGDHVGAVVALDPNNGEVLAMASMPTFNQSDFVQGISTEKWRELLNNPLHPLENRAVSGQYPPGSTYKIISAAAALEEGVIRPESIIPCSGAYPFGNRVFNCWRRTGHGSVNLKKSLKESCDVYYYEVGRRLGVDRLAHYAGKFGLGKKTEVGLANEKAGLVPDSEWKLRRFKIPWQKGETLSVVIGQGYNLATPLQLAQVIATTANSGIMYRPHLIKRITSAGGEVVKEFTPEIIGKLDFKPDTFPLIREALTAVVNEPGGTGGRSRITGIEVAGKTGTSQVVTLKRYQGVPKSKLPYEYQDHALFVAFAPFDQPRIAVAAVVEHAGHGGAMAGPVVKKVMEAFFYPDRIDEATASSDQPTSDNDPEESVLEVIGD